MPVKTPEQIEEEKIAKTEKAKAKEAEKAKDILMTVPSTGEKVVYSEKVHGKDYREIAENTARRFGGVVTEIE
jgi:DNA-directed RNA polymerase specialized sigma24 family protein